MQEQGNFKPQTMEEIAEEFKLMNAQIIEHIRKATGPFDEEEKIKKQEMKRTKKPHLQS